MPPALVFSGLLFGRGGVLGLLGVFFAGFPCGLCLGGSRRVKDAGGRLLLGADALIGGRLFLGACLAGEGSVLGSGLAPFSGGVSVAAGISLRANPARVFSSICSRSSST